MDGLGGSIQSSLSAVWLDFPPGEVGHGWNVVMSYITQLPLPNIISLALEDLDWEWRDFFRSHQEV